MKSSRHSVCCRGVGLFARPHGGGAVRGRCYITAAYWFTASTSFANPAVAIARAFTDTFTGIRPIDVPVFVVAQAIGAMAATTLFRWLVPKDEPEARRDLQ